jgi:hypothetical protein
LARIGGIVRHEFAAAANHSEAFVYLCDNELRFLSDLPPEVTSAQRVLTSFITVGQDRGEIRRGDAKLMATMLSGALCAAALAWLRRHRRKPLSTQLEEIAETCWQMIAA